MPPTLLPPGRVPQGLPGGRQRSRSRDAPVPPRRGEEEADSEEEEEEAPEALRGKPTLPSGERVAL
eukprot:2365439-Alexandrium_andersonii.AAC.1